MYVSKFLIPTLLINGRINTIFHLQYSILSFNICHTRNHMYIFIYTKIFRKMGSLLFIKLST